ncbi:hypothetical protein BDF21DRAFT_417388 [Thamnidium elegans]|nr:hypothetical protein BDF21DRAFT_417388 [Thamnidium elegans]
MKLTNLCMSTKLTHLIILYRYYQAIFHILFCNNDNFYIKGFEWGFCILFIVKILGLALILPLIKINLFLKTRDPIQKPFQSLKKQYSYFLKKEIKEVVVKQFECFI